jgi:transcriptional regulator with XRE-family HTH domain
VNGSDPRQLLARHLRALREDHWVGKRITQQQLARALGGVSVPLISSWESQAHPRIPPLPRLDAYAALFATPRSFDAEIPGPLSPADMSAEERQQMDELKRELRQLRNAALQADVAAAPQYRGVQESINATPWRFEDGGIVTIVCAQMPKHMLDKIPYTNVDDPDYIELLKYAELDSLLELHGHIRAANPASHVYLRTAGRLGPDDYHTHLAVLGGVDWNVETRMTLEKLELPVRQIADWDAQGEQYYEVDENGIKTKHRPVLARVGDRTILQEDVALFARAINPFNRRRTITICNGMYGRGTYGAVRALTDANFRDRNSDYVRSRFSGCDAYCVLMRVPIVHGATTTPDWTLDDHVLFEWSR